MAPLLRRMLYVPPSMPIGALLQRMQTSRTHIALVIDEFGGVDGLVTMEDLVEQVVGEIEDEHDEAEAVLFREEAPGVYNVNARAELPEFEAVAGVDLLPDAAMRTSTRWAGSSSCCRGASRSAPRLLPIPTGTNSR